MGLKADILNARTAVVEAEKAMNRSALKYKEARYSKPKPKKSILDTKKRRAAKWKTAYENAVARRDALEAELAVLRAKK
jgi:hypothetical protein